jgi:chromate transporter
VPPPPAAEESSAGGRTPRSPVELFLAFALLSIQSFGGALSFMERTVVRDKRWLSAKEFLGLYGISQVLPGPSGISFCVLLGDRFFGLRGAIATLAGFLLLPAFIVIGLASVFQHFQHVSQVQGALHGMGAAAAGLIVSTALRMARTLRGNRIGIAVAIVVFLAVAIARLPVSTVVLTIGVASVALAWRGRRP